MSSYNMGAIVAPHMRGMTKGLPEVFSDPSSAFSLDSAGKFVPEISVITLIFYG
jgi:hypothetical protein